MIVETDTKLLCQHCGEVCTEEVISSDDKVFCCNGCLAVYDLLHESGLQGYYESDLGSPGISLKNTGNMNFEYLDHAEISSRVLNYRDNTLAIATFRTPQIHCASCVWLLENLSRINPHVKHSQVFFEKREVTIRFDISRLPLSELVRLLSKIGYKPDLNLDKVSQKKQVTGNRSLYLKIGVAGFAFGNIMLFSLPDYLAGAEGVDDQFLRLFGGLNILLALPVFFYSSLDFFRPAWNSIKNRFWSMDIAISLGIIAMFFRSLYEIFNGLSIGYMDSFTMLVFLLLVGRLFQKKTYDQLSFDRDYRSYFPLAVTRLTNGMEQSVAATQILKDDHILIRHSELLPADAVLISESASLDYSFVTGEADPVLVHKGQTCYAGGRNTDTSAEFRVINPVSASYLTRLWNHDVFAKRDISSIHSLSQQFSRYFSPAVLAIAALSALYWYPSSPSTAINAFTAVLIVACPCALALSAPFTLGWVTNLLSRNKVYLKKGEVAEILASSDTLVFDKTGTLTRRDSNEINFYGRDLSSREIDLLTSLLHENTHPHGRAFYQWLRKNRYNFGQHIISNYKEVTGAGVSGYVDGVLVKIGSASWIGVDNVDSESEYLRHRRDQERPGDIRNSATGAVQSSHFRSREFSVVSDISESGSVQHPRLYFSIDGEVPGYAEIRSTFRDGVEGLINRLKHKFDLFVLSGDNSRDKIRLSGLFDENMLLFNQSPQDKLNTIETLNSQGRRTVMVGDGLNDAGALMASHVGISVSDDTVSFTPASDIIMDSEALSNIDKILDFCRAGVKIIYTSFGISVLYNIVGLGFAVTGTLSPLVCAIIMPVSSITVIAYTSLATHWTAKRKGL